MISEPETSLQFLDKIWKHGKKIALRTKSGDAVTYEELQNATNDISSTLDPARSLAILECSNTPQNIAMYLAFISKGVVPILVPSNLAQVSLYNLVNTYKPRYVYTSASFSNSEYFQRELKSGYVVFERIDDFVSKLNRDLVLLLPTSGSTGSPKMVRISEKNLTSNSNMILSSLPISDSDIAITTLPFSYSYGLSILNTHLLAGATLVLNEYSLIQRAFWDLFFEARVNTFGGVPFTFQQINDVGFSRLGGNIKYLTQAGGKLPPFLLKNINEASARQKFDFYIMYGQTEATARMSVLNPRVAVDKIGSVGQAISPGQFSIDSDKVEISDELSEGSGELIYKGPNVAMGYAECIGDLSKPDEWQGELRTGDLARLDSEGFAYITGRLSRFVKIRGLRISLDDLENQFLKFGYETAVTEMDSTILVATSSLLLKLSLSEILRNFPALRRNDFLVLELESIPRKSNGKVDYLHVSSLARHKFASSQS